MSNAHPERGRLLKGDAEIIAIKLRAMGFEGVSKNDDSVTVLDRGIYVCGFFWVPAQQEGASPAHPGHWAVNYPVEVHCLADIGPALHELKRAYGWRLKLRESWTLYHKSRSDKRWSGYRSYLAALFTRQTPVD